MKTLTFMGRPTFAASVIVLATLGALTGCAASSPTAPSTESTASSSATGPTPTPIATQTPTAAADAPTPAPTPAAVAASPDDPIDALSAWHACAVLGLANYAANSPGAILHPYDSVNTPTQNADGTFQVIAAFPLQHPVPGAGSIVIMCTIGGTLGNPTLVSWATKDI